MEVSQDTKCCVLDCKTVAFANLSDVFERKVWSDRVRLAGLPREDFGYGLRAFRIGKEKRLFCCAPVFFSANTYSKTATDIPALKLLHLTAIIEQSTAEVRKIKAR